MDQAGLGGHTVCHQHPLPAHSSGTFSWVVSSVDYFVLVLIFATLAGGRGPNGIHTRGEPIGFHPFAEGNRRYLFQRLFCCSESSPLAWHYLLPFICGIVTGFLTKSWLAE